MKTKLLLFLLFFSLISNAQTNLVPNGGFETWTNSTTLSNWTIKNNVTRNTSSFTEGSKSAQLSIANSTTKPEIIGQIPMTAGKTYTVKFKYKYVTNNYSGQHPISLNISQNGSATTLSSSTYATDNNWTVNETTFTPDQNMSYDLSISLFTFDAAAFNVLIDDVQVYIQGTEQYTLISDVNFEKKLIALGIDSGATDGKVLTNSVNKLTSLDVSNSAIVDLTGIQDFVALKTLDCYNNKLITLDVSKNLSLTSFGCNDNQLTSLDVSKNVALKSLICSSNKLTTIDVSKNLALTSFYCSSNQLTALDVTKNVALRDFYCHTNKLTSLNLKNGKNTLLTNSNINLSSNPDLMCIIVDDATYSNTNWANKKDAAAIYSPYDCSTVTPIPDAKFEDKLIALGIDIDGKNGVVLNSSITAITSLNVSNSAIADLTGIQAFTALTTLNCSGNLLKKLDVSKNTAIATLNCANNPTLICIQVADVTATANWTTTKDATASFNLDCTIYTLIPDAKFEDKLIALGIDQDGKNGKVATESIASLTSLDVSFSSISDLTGIQDFINLKKLTCRGNSSFSIGGDGKLTTLDLSKNVQLTDLDLYGNQINSLDISQNILLTQLNVQGNKLIKIDVSKNVALTSINCSFNLLTTLDVSKNISLSYLECNSNQLRTFDVTKNMALKYLSCQSTLLNTIDVSKNSALTLLDCSFNKIVNIDVTSNINLKNLTIKYNRISTIDVSKNTLLENFYCGSNKLRSLDLTKNTVLKTFECDYNELKRLNLKNGNNIKLTYISLVGNPDLSCIQVDDVVYSNTNWPTRKDATASFNSDCAYSTAIPDQNFEDKLIALGIDTDGKNGKVLTANIVNLTALDVSNSMISDLNGIQDFDNLKSLNCSQNVLTKVDLSKNPYLVNLNISNNQLSTLNVNYNILLESIHCNNNLLKTLDLSRNTKVSEIYCPNNKLISLNLKNGNNSFSSGPSIKNFTNNPSLTCIQVDDTTFSNANWSNYKDAAASYNTDCDYSTAIPDPNFEDQLIALGIDTDGKNGKVLTSNISNETYLRIPGFLIADLTGIQDFTSLKYLDCSFQRFNGDTATEGKITSLDVSNNTELTELNCGGLKLTTLDVSKNIALQTLNLGFNQVLNIDISNNPVLVNLYCRSNRLTTLDVSKNLALKTLDCSYNKLATIDVSKNTKLAYFDCTDALLTSLDVSKNSSLKTLDFERNKLTSIDVSKNLELQNLNCSQNGIISLDVTKNKVLYRLECSGINGGSTSITSLNLNNNSELTILNFSSNQIEKIDLSSNNKLQILRCYGNILSSLDISKNTALTELSCSYNKLKSVNFKNGNNTKATIDLTNNPYLSCIQVDDIAYSNTNWATKKDATAIFSSDCAYSTAIPDPKFEDKLIALGIDTDGINGKVLTANITNLTSLDVSNAVITDLTGIEDFTALQSLSCDHNALTKIDVSKNLYLVSLNIANNQLAMLNVVNNTKLQTIHCNDNLLRTLDFSKNTSLTEIYCPNNKLIALNLKNGNNAVSNGPSIKNFTNNPDLSCIQVDDVVYSNTNWSLYKDTTANYSSDCAYSTAIPDPKFEDKLIALGIDTDGKNGKVLTANIMYLTNLDVSSSSIKDLTGIQDFVSLKNLNCKSNLLTSIDISKNSDLITLNCYSNDLINIDVSKNINLTSLNLDFNETTNLNIANNSALTFLSCYYNKNTSLDVSKNIALTYLDCSGNPLTFLDVSKNVSLTYLASSYGKLTSLDVSKNKALTTLYCGNNYLTNLDVSNNIALTKFGCSYNKLQFLNLKNGKNTLIDKSNFSLTGNSNLYCILVDDVTYSNANWTSNKDTTAKFNTECNGLTLPANNFTVESKGETCTDSKNGEINISATAAYIYKANINGKSYSFTNNSLKVPNLAPGSYTVSITITGETFEQSYTIVIPKATTITGKSSVTANKVAVEIATGTAPYTVFVDGIEQFETTESSFSVETKKGGVLEVKTAKACEGIYAATITGLEGAVTAYPNPTSGSFEVQLPTSKKEVVIALYTLNGQLISNKTYTVENGKARLTLENQPAGVYIAKIEFDTPDYLKIIKN